MKTTIKGLSSRVLLVILDGFGVRENTLNNAVESSNTPEIDDLFQNYPCTQIESGGLAVGLPKGVCGNSEVGHLNLGAGRPIRQDLVRINEYISNNTLKDIPLLNELKGQALKGTKRIHLMGLLSDGAVHSHIEHLKEFIKILSTGNDIEIFFHAFMDGRDTPITNGLKYVEDLEKVPGFTFASMGGRSIGMDRDRRWEKIERAYKTMVGEGNVSDLTPIEYLQHQYNQKIYDEFITPTLFAKENAIKDGDAIFFCNFRPDRARQMTLAMADPSFNDFQTSMTPGYFLCLTPYVEDELELPVLLTKEPVKGGLAQVLSGKNMQQFKVAETEKYAHVTYFFNGGRKEPFPGEERCLVPSNREVETYDEDPTMRAYEITEKLLPALDNNDFKFCLVNYANSDMIGHTGNFEAALKAVETLDECIGKLKMKCQEKGIA
jgi:2,3-bisphosphoglycerate-independent phosphoglycerate mutase